MAGFLLAISAQQTIHGQLWALTKRGNPKAFFETLLYNADNFGISISVDSGIDLDFRCDCKLGLLEIYLYYPSEHDLTKSELDALCEEYSEADLSRAVGCAQALPDVDVDNDEAALKNCLSGFQSAEEPTVSRIMMGFRGFTMSRKNRTQEENERRAKIC